jgi:UDP-galactopyranose mutase
MPDSKNILIVGAGFTGAVIARRLAEAGHSCTVIDERDHVAGNCHTERDAETGVMVHVYGPHIFHTDKEDVWDFINEHCEMMPYRHQVKAQVNDRVYAMPINLHTINQFFDKTMSPKEAQDYVSEIAESGEDEPKSFEDQAMRFVGKEIYEGFFKGYTLKQWGVHPNQLPASILKRLPLRFTYDDNYFAHRFQGIPKDGYTSAVASILDCAGVEVRLGTSAEDVNEAEYDHILYTGPLDRYIDHKFGRLAYRTLRFEKEIKDAPFQGTAVMNYCDQDVPYTRITEHMYFAPSEVSGIEKSVIYTEYSDLAGPDDIPYYPVRLVEDKALLNQYVELANETPKVTFAGRLGSYAYLDMDVSIKRAFETADHIQAALEEDRHPDSFVHEI